MRYLCWGMAKKKPTAPKKRTAKASSKKGNLRPVRVETTTVPPWQTPGDDRFRRTFWIAAAVMGLLMLLLSTQVGVNGDDSYQNRYSHTLLDWYGTMGEDTSALYIKDGNMHFYGGLFDLTTGVVNATLGFEESEARYHTVRHLFNALFGFLALLYTGLLARLLGGWRMGLLALVLLFLSPRFLGHSLMNPKDIPFAAGFIVAIYYMVRYFRTMPAPDWRDLAGMVIGIGIAVGSRAGGLLLIGYLGLFSLINMGLRGTWSAIGRYVGYGAAVSIGGFLLGILFWPFALVDPIAHPIEALTEFSKLGVRIRVLFEGELFITSETAWYYPLSWIFRTIPPFALIGFFGGLVLLPRMLKKFPKTPVLLVLFAAAFPLVYVLLGESLLHDGWRHLTFLYPPMVVFVALFWTTLYDWLAEKKTAQYAVVGILALCLLDPVQHIVRNPKIPYVYFNAFTGGMAGNYGYFETDYWGTAVRQAVEWMEDEGILHADMDTTTIASSFSYNMSRYFDDRYRGRVKFKYIKYNARFKSDWDYAIFSSRYVRGPHIQSGNWLTDRALHTIDVSGKPVAVIMKTEANDRAIFEAETAMKDKDFSRAIAQFRAETERHPLNEQAWIGLANSYAQVGQPEETRRAAAKVLEIAPENVIAYHFKGFAELQTGNQEDAKRTFERALEVNPQYSPANYYLAVIYRERGDLRTALEYANASYRYNAKFVQGKQLAQEIGQLMQQR